MGMEGVLITIFVTSFFCSEPLPTFKSRNATRAGTMCTDRARTTLWGPLRGPHKLYKPFTSFKMIF